MAIPKIDSTFDRLSNPEAAQYLGLSVHTLDSWRCLKKPFIPYLKVGARVFYKKSDLDEYLGRVTVTG